MATAKQRRDVDELTAMVADLLYPLANWSMSRHMVLVAGAMPTPRFKKGDAIPTNWTRANAEGELATHSAFLARRFRPALLAA